jgi:dihydroorotate dehydrogenase (fumarate)
MAVLLEGLESWMAARGFERLDQVRGIMSQQKLRDPLAFERANYIRILQGYRPGVR